MTPPSHPHEHPPEHPDGQPPRRRRRRLRNLLIIVAVVAVVCCGGLITAGVLAVRAGISALGPLRDASNVFLNDLQDNDYNGAYGGLCASLRGQLSVDQFTQEVQSKPHIRGHQLGTVSVANVNGRNTGLVNAQLTRDDGSADTQSFTLDKEDGGWKVCNQPPY